MTTYPLPGSRTILQFDQLSNLRGRFLRTNSLSFEDGKVTTVATDLNRLGSEENREEGEELAG